MSSVMRLEDFAAPRRQPAQRFSVDDLAREYQRGLDAGEALGRDAAMTELTEALLAAHSSALNEAEIRRSAIDDTLAAIGPILQAVARQLASAPSERLTDQLSAELARLCHAGIAPTCRISGNVELIERLGTRIGEMGLTGVTILPGPRTEITFAGGHIAIAPDEMTGQIMAILSEIQNTQED